jgi:hypothetical protein
MVLRKTELKPQWERILGIPVFSAVLAVQVPDALCLLLRIEADANALTMGGYALVCGLLYLLVQRTLFSGNVTGFVDISRKLCYNELQEKTVRGKHLS